MARRDPATETVARFEHADREIAAGRELGSRGEPCRAGADDHHVEPARARLHGCEV
jgi:hypothetical protein